MKCSKCGAECQDDIKFCTQCGAPMGDESQMTKAEPQNEEKAEADATQESGTAEGQAETAEGQAGTAEAQAETAEAQAETAEGQAETAEAQAETAEAQAETAEAAADQAAPTQARTESAAQAPAAPAEPQPKKGFVKVLAAVVILAAVIAVAALAYVKLNEKDPKQVVIDAFENVYTKDQVFPAEELFGTKEFAEAAGKTDTEGGLTLKMDSCSDPSVNAYAGSGLRFEGKDDRTNNRTSFNMGVIYNGMDLANLDAYYGDDTLMMAIPELSSRVFTVDLGDGLADRIKNSPTVGPLLEQNGVDVDGLAAYFTDLIAESEQAQEEGKAPFDLDALVTRYKEGCKAQDNFKAAMTVTKADKGTFTMNGAEVSCKGYDVVISKDSMVEFLRTSSDFFLQDETLKGDFLRQLEATVKMSELMGGTMSGTGSMSAEEMQQQAYDEVKDAVDQMITYLDKSLTDVQMTVYVDKKGNLAAVNGTTSLHIEDADEGKEDIAVEFSFELQGGAYLTQNMKGSINLTNDGETATVALTKQGTYDGKKLTCDISVDVTAPDASAYNFMYTGTYDSNDGSYHAGLEVGGDGSQYFKMSATGVIDQLEKGKTFHMDIDALEIAVMDNAGSVVLSGELYSRPLEGEVAPLEGESMDVLAATVDDWNSVLMEMVMGVIGLAGQLDVPMY